MLIFVCIYVNRIHQYYLHVQGVVKLMVGIIRDDRPWHNKQLSRHKDICFPEMENTIKFKNSPMKTKNLYYKKVYNDRPAATI